MMLVKGQNAVTSSHESLKVAAAVGEGAERLMISSGDQRSTRLFDERLK